MMDASFLAELRAWADQARAAFEDQAEVAWHQGEQRTAEVANLAARTFAGLQTICDRQIGGERARLVATAEAAEARVRVADEEFGAADQAAGRLRERDHGPYPPTPARRAHILSRQRETEGAADEARRELAVALRAVRAFDAATAGGE